MPRPFVFLALALSTSAFAEPLSRAAVVARALEANPDVRKSLEDRKLLDGRKREAIADALPELKLLGTFNRFRDPSLLNSSSFDSFPPELRDALRPIPASLYEGFTQLNQTLFSFKLGAAIRAARLATTLGQEDVRRARQSIALAAVRAYNDYLLALEKVKVGEKAVKQKEKHLESVRNRRAAGVATELDELRSRVDLENQRTQLLRFEGEADQARGVLNAVMVRPIDTPIEPSDGLDFEPLEMTLDDAVKEAWTNRPEAKTAALNERVLDELVTVAQSDSRPRLEFQGIFGFSVRRPSNFFQSDFQRWSAGVTLTVPVFDGFRTAGRVAQARANRHKAAQDTVALENRIRLEAKAAVDRLRVAKSILDVAELNVSQAQKAADMTQATYDYGAATILDVIDAQAALTLAESNRIQALYEHADARATLRYVTARDPLDPPATSPPTSADPGTTKR